VLSVGASINLQIGDESPVWHRLRFRVRRTARSFSSTASSDSLPSSAASPKLQLVGRVRYDNGPDKHYNRQPWIDRICD
jgi:hypothetical protein